MKKIALVLTSMLFIACSAPKYTYNFDHYSSRKTTPLKSTETDDKQEQIATNAALPFKTSNDDTAVQTAPPGLTASASNEPLIYHNRQVAATDVHDVAINSTSTEKRGFVKALKNFIKSPDAVQEGGNKNGFAIAGFVCALVGLFVLWPLCILGLIFSVIGLKSHMKGLAIAGLVLGIVGVALVLVGSANGTI